MMPSYLASMYMFATMATENFTVKFTIVLAVTEHAEVQMC